MQNKKSSSKLFRQETEANGIVSVVDAVLRVTTKSAGTARTAIAALIAVMTCATAESASMATVGRFNATFVKVTEDGGCAFQVENGAMLIRLKEEKALIEAESNGSR